MASGQNKRMGPLPLFIALNKKPKPMHSTLNVVRRRITCFRRWWLIILSCSVLIWNINHCFMIVLYCLYTATASWPIKIGCLIEGRNIILCTQQLSNFLPTCWTYILFLSFSINGQYDSSFPSVGKTKQSFQKWIYHAIVKFKLLNFNHVVQEPYLKFHA